MAEPKITNAIPSPIFRVRGVKNWIYPDRRITAEDCETLKNINITEEGTADKRNGYTPYNANQILESTVAMPIVGLFQQVYTGAQSRNIVVAGTKIYAAAASGSWSSLDITGSVSITNTPEGRIRHDFIDNQIVGTNGINGTFLVPATGNATALAGMPWSTCEDVVVHNNLLVALNTTESATKFPTRARWCDINKSTYVIDIATWPDANRYEVEDEGLPIVGGANNFGRLLIFKQNGLFPAYLRWNLGFIEMLVLENQIYRGFSPIAKASIISRPEFTWCVARDGAYIVVPNGDGFNVKLVTKDIQRDWNALAQNRLQYAQSFIRQKDHQVRTLLSSSTNTTGHDRILVYDWETGDVFWDNPNDDLNTVCSSSLGYRETGEEFDFFGTYDGYVMKGNIGTQDNVTDIPWEIKWHANDLGLQARSKNIVNFRLFYQEQSVGLQDITVTLNLNHGQNARTTTMTLGSGNLYDNGLEYDTGLEYGSLGVNSASYHVNRVAENIAPQLTSSQSASIIGYQCDFDPTEPISE